MRNRAKCRLCGDIIESFHSTDFVICKCGAIGVNSGPAMKCSANDWNDFLRVDDDGNEIIVKTEGSIREVSSRPTREDKIRQLEEIIKAIESLPSHAMQEPITHYDLSSVLSLVVSILRSA